MSSATMKFVQPTTPEVDLRHKPEPVVVYGLEFLTELEARIAALEDKLASSKSK